MEKCKPYFEKIAEIVHQYCLVAEGNVYEAGDLDNILSNIPIQMNLITLAQKSSKILEIGFNAGHSALIMLMANPNCKIVDIDICSHPYTVPCFQYLSFVFPDRLSLLTGHSHDILSNYNDIVDMVHIDGGHSPSIANIDFFLSKDKVRKGGVIVMDDTWLEHINCLWEGYIRDGHITEIQLVPTKRHRFGYKN